MRFITFIFALFIGFSFSLNAQNNGNKRDLIQFSGVLVSSDSLDQVSYASVIDKTTGKGTMSDYYGYFSFVTRPGDTILFNAFGYKTSSYIVPDSLNETRYSIIHVMTPDTLLLPEVDIYPWPSREDFARAFVEMDPYDDALRRAQKQLSGESLAFIASRVPTDGKLSYNWQTEQRLTQIYTQGQAPMNNLLNPAAWGRFIDSWKNGELQRE
ncbi:carboxypeptidase-like regulatory domain-containing protein [Brumimicrobium mesophilum]|uniref:carboxypeptidase-like regulatory domain-containing protein n=1 Tax=Brumimicrobium mesophilum TaxID=392717 RepID=UPI000D1408AD|nr:carboxypeptidase-like regulatory domain-containing protein [Brumimicrobium mesophilum]